MAKFAFFRTRGITNLGCASVGNFVHSCEKKLHFDTCYENIYLLHSPTKKNKSPDLGCRQLSICFRGRWARIWPQNWAITSRFGLNLKNWSNRGLCRRRRKQKRNISNWKRFNGFLTNCFGLFSNVTFVTKENHFFFISSLLPDAGVWKIIFKQIYVYLVKK